MKQTIIVILSFYLASCGGGTRHGAEFIGSSLFESPASTEAYARAFDDQGVGAKAIRGIWEARAYGIVLHIPANEPPVQYLYSSTGCSRETLTAEDIGEQFHLYILDKDGQGAGFTDAVGGTLYRFRRLTDLPELCAIPTDTTAAANLDFFMAHVEDCHPTLSKQGLDWPSLKREARAIVETQPDEAGLFAALSHLVQGLDDPHTNILEAIVSGVTQSVYAGYGPTLIALFQQREPEPGLTHRAIELDWVKDFRARIADDLLSGKGHRGGRGLIDYGLLPNQIGYIQILGFGDYTREGGLAASVSEAHRILNHAAEIFREAPAVIVDVSQNRGGYDIMARAVASHFADRHMPVFTSRPHRGDPDRAQVFTIDPTGLTTYSGTIYLMTSDITVSAAEIFTLAMRALPQVTHIGTPTRGALSVELARSLPNGWVFGISSEVYLDMEGNWFEGRGIPPHESMEIFDRGNLYSDVHIQRVRDLAARIKILVRN